MEDFWKVVCKGKDNIRFMQAESYSPYSEISMNGIQQMDDNLTQVSVNGFYRYDSIMQPLFGKKSIPDSQKAWLFDIYMHYLTELEYRSGTTYQDYLIRKFQMDLEEGMYGQEIQECFERLDKDEKFTVAHSLFCQQSTRESVERFADTLVAVLHNGVVYKNELNEKELYIYISSKKNDEDISKIYLVQQLFQPMGYESRIFWEQHFAVFGEEQTLRMDEIELI